MGTILEYLGGDHRACDELFASAEAAVAQKNWGSAHDLFDRFQAAMVRHLAMEENVLFPAFEAHTGNSMGPTQIMRMEHQQIRDLIQNMARAVANSNHNSYLGLSETLNMLMQQHNMKEETMLYPMSDQVLGSERDAVIRAMEAIAP
ncbi:MAG: hemerythrin domain-containing protein [Sulfuriferula multivorans]|uniref:Hemerythrin domain-containing protein n=1 Tax=Sulfuriferula multivorans TaxID=1559896 RepID=A0A7C9K0J9_9PROT|nr:hemerythrin domain-containing protein [Sulfuriferula multivorans]